MNTERRDALRSETPELGDAMFERLVQIIDENAPHVRFALDLDEFDELPPTKVILVADAAVREDFEGWSNLRLAGLRTALQQRKNGLALSDYYADGPLGTPGLRFALWQLQGVISCFINRVTERLVLRAVRMEYSRPAGGVPDEAAAEETLRAKAANAFQEPR